MRNFTLACTFALTTGCAAFYDQAAVNGVTRTTFDESLPDALTEVFEACAEPVVIEEGTDELDFAGSCDLDDVESAAADTLLAGLLINGPIDLDEPVDGDLFRDTFTVGGFPWPMQNCEIDFTVDLDLDSLSLRNLESAWVTRSGSPSLWIDFDFPTSPRVATARITGNVRCPSAINDGLLQATINTLLPNGGRAVTVTGLDLDIWSKLSHDGETISGDLALDVDLSEVLVDSWLTNLAAELGFDVLDLMALFGMEPAMVEDQIETALRPALASLPDQVAAMVQDAIPDGHRICNLEIVDTDRLRVTSDDPGIMSCVQMIPRRL